MVLCIVACDNAESWDVDVSRPLASVIDTKDQLTQKRTIGAYEHHEWWEILSL